MKKLFTIIAFTLFLAISANAQDSAPDTVKLIVAFTNSEFSDILSTEYQQGLTAELSAKMFRKAAVKVEGVFQFNRAALGEPALDTYSFGPQLGVDLFNGHVTPFGRVLFGVQTPYNHDKVFTRTYGAGLDINLGHIVIRPIAIDFPRTEGLLTPNTQRYSVGVGVRF